MAALPGLTRRKTMLFDEELQRADSMESLSVDVGPGWDTSPSQARGVQVRLDRRLTRCDIHR